VAHDFNNLLVGMLGHSSLALSRLPPESPGRANLEKVIQAAERAADLSRQMLAYSGRGHFQVRPTDLNTLVSENLHLLEAAVPKTARLSARLSEQAAVVEADVGQLQQLVMNLVLNAAEASGEHPGVVTISTEMKRLSTDGARYSRFTGRDLPPGPYVQLEVRDDGCGMDEETLSRVFDPFFTTKFTGRGLGLAAVLGVVRGHRGGIEIDSRPGGGTSFRILLPATEDRPESPVDTAPRKISGGATILVIDDEKTVRDTLREMLLPLGWEVLTAPDGAAGVALFEERAQDIRLVVLDLSMPGLTGEQTFHALREHDPEVPVVLSSGFSEEEAVRRFEGLGLSGFLQKPYRLETLVDTIRHGIRIR
jgi:CheY-like chemotaxis protein